MIHPLSSRVYARLLQLYPEDLRRDHGPEMALVFADDLAAARREAGLPGILRVWRCALGEFFRFALPAHASSSQVRVPAISLALFVAMLAGNTLPLASTVRIAFVIPLFSPPLLALLALWACRSHAVQSLHLTPHRSQEE